MNARSLQLSLLSACALALTLGCDFSDLLTGGDAEGTPKLGRWTITELTGEIQMVDSGVCSGSWTFPAELESSWNGVKVDWGGEFEYYLGFKGVPGSPHPDGYNHAGRGAGKSGVISFHNVREDLGSEDTVEGTYDDQKMVVKWTMEQHVGDGCKTDVVGSGTFTAIPPQ